MQSRKKCNVGVTFEALEDGAKAPAGWSKVTGHLVFDLQWISPERHGGSWMATRCQTLMVQRVLVWCLERVFMIAFTHAALNGLSIHAADIRNACLQAPSSQKNCITCGPEFGIENVGKVALTHRALCGGKAAGRDFRNHLRSCMHFLHFEPCPADPDAWMQPAIKSDGLTCCKHVLLHMDDALVVSENAESMLRNEIG